MSQPSPFQPTPGQPPKPGLSPITIIASIVGGGFLLLFIFCCGFPMFMGIMAGPQIREAREQQRQLDAAQKQVATPPALGQPASVVATAAQPVKQRVTTDDPRVGDVFEMRLSNFDRATVLDPKAIVALGDMRTAVDQAGIKAMQDAGLIQELPKGTRITVTRIQGKTSQMPYPYAEVTAVLPGSDTAKRLAIHMYYMNDSFLTPVLPAR